MKNSLAELLPQASGYLPKTLMVLAVLFIGWIIAKSVAGLFRKLVRGTGITSKLNELGIFRVEKGIGKLVYYLIMVIVLMVALDLMGVKNVLAPLQNMVNEFVAFLPNIIAAGIIGYVGYVLATIVSEAIRFGGSFFEKYGAKAGIDNGDGLLNVAKRIVFVIVFVPILIVALDALNMEAISKPATLMFEQLLTAIPKILVAGIILTLFYYVGRFISNTIQDILRNMNADNLPAKLGLEKVMGNSVSLSKLSGNIVYFFIMFTGVVMAVEKLEFTQFSAILQNLMVLSGKVLLGVIILTLGNFIATIAKNSISKNTVVSKIVYFALLSLFLAMGLRSMGIADDIVNLAFGLTLGAAAVAFALAFGLGGREAAGKELAEWFKKLKD